MNVHKKPTSSRYWIRIRIFPRVYRYLRESYDSSEYDKVICTSHMYSNVLKTKIILCYDHIENLKESNVLQQLLQQVCKMEPSSDTGESDNECNHSGVSESKMQGKYN